MTDLTDRARLARNKDLVEAMRRGDDLNAFSSFHSWWPDRSKGNIPKDQKAIKSLYYDRKDPSDSDPLSTEERNSD